MRYFSEQELRMYMGKCIELALQTPSNIFKPHVGVLVLSPELEIVGQGYKNFIEGTYLIKHAERVALDHARDKSRGGILFSTLEPCWNMRRPTLLKSCSELIVERGIAQVIVGAVDCSLPGEIEQREEFYHENRVSFYVFSELEKEILDKLLLRPGEIRRNSEANQRIFGRMMSLPFSRRKRSRRRHLT